MSALGLDKRCGEGVEGQKKCVIPWQVGGRIHYVVLDRNFIESEQLARLYNIGLLRNTNY